jgi:hypothetical protein
MTVSEYKIENHKSITAEVAENQPLFDGTYASEGDKLIDCFLVSEEGIEKLIYLIPSQISLFEIIEDAEYDVFTPLSEQKFKVKLK